MTIYHGKRDLSSGNYQVWLIEQYGIKKNEVLNKYLCDDQLFDTIDAALTHAHELNIERDMTGVTAQQTRSTTHGTQLPDTASVAADSAAQSQAQELADHEIWFDESKQRYIYQDKPYFDAEAALVAARKHAKSASQQAENTRLEEELRKFGEELRFDSLFKAKRFSDDSVGGTAKTNSLSKKGGWLILGAFWLLVLLVVVASVSPTFEQVNPQSSNPRQTTSAQSGSPGHTASRGMGSSGELYIKAVQLQQRTTWCMTYFDVQNEGTQTFQMWVELLYRTPQGQIINTSPLQIVVRGGQTVTKTGVVEEDCNVIGSIKINATQMCKVDGNFVEDEICWRSLNVESGVIPLTK